MNKEPTLYRELYPLYDRPRASSSTSHSERMLRDLNRHMEGITVVCPWQPPLTNEERQLGLESEDSVQLPLWTELESSQSTNPLHC